MTNATHHHLIASLKQMIAHCQDIQLLLKNDRNHFSKDEISAIEDSNKSKSILLEYLAKLLHELSTHTHKDNSHNFIEAIEETAKNFDEYSKLQLQTLIHELKAEIATCYECLIINSKVVYTNLQQLRTLWEKINTCRTEINFVYDSRGGTLK